MRYHPILYASPFVWASITSKLHQDQQQCYLSGLSSIQHNENMAVPEFLRWLITSSNGVRQYALENECAVMDRVAELCQRFINCEEVKETEWLKSIDDAIVAGATPLCSTLATRKITDHENAADLALYVSCSFWAYNPNSSLLTAISTSRVITYKKMANKFMEIMQKSAPDGLR